MSKNAFPCPKETADRKSSILIFFVYLLVALLRIWSVCPAKGDHVEVLLVSQFSEFQVVIRETMSKNTFPCPKEIADRKSSILIFFQHDSHDSKSTSW